MPKTTITFKLLLKSGTGSASFDSSKSLLMISISNTDATLPLMMPIPITGVTESSELENIQLQAFDHNTMLSQKEFTVVKVDSLSASLASTTNPVTKKPLASNVI